MSHPTLTEMAELELRPAVFYFASQLLQEHPETEAVARLKRHRETLTPEQMAYVKRWTPPRAQGQLALW